VDDHGASVGNRGALGSKKNATGPGSDSASAPLREPSIGSGNFPSGGLDLWHSRGASPPASAVAPDMGRARRRARVTSCKSAAPEAERQPCRFSRPSERARGCEGGGRRLERYRRRPADAVRAEALREPALDRGELAEDAAGQDRLLLATAATASE